MQLLRAQTRFNQPSVVGIGNFDGLHLGHQAVLNTVIEASQKEGLASTVMTFEPPPQQYFKAPNFARLMSFYEKYVGFSNLGLDACKCIRFNKEVANLDPHAFVTRFLVGDMQAKIVVVGDDFRFGANRSGDVRTLTAIGSTMGFQVIEVPELTINNQRVTSSAIRSCLGKNDLMGAATLLGHSYTIFRRVQHGAQRGRLLGFPTANIALEEATVLRGVYAVKLILPNESAPILGVANIGRRPTFGFSNQVWLEVHAFDWTGELYGEQIGIEFHSKIRDEKKFDGIDDLRQAIIKDVQIARQLLDHI